MRYIMSGSRGLIGEKLKQRLDDRGDKCILEIDQRAGSNILNLDSYQLTPTTQHTDIFFHLGAFCKISETVKNPRLSHYNNACGTFEALEFCRKNNIKKFVYMSSSRILSKEKNPYTASKMYGEYLCEAYRQCYGIEYIIIRPSTVYGEHHDLTTRLITKLIINAMKGKPLIIYGDDKKTLDFTHVDDFVDGVELLIIQWEKTKNDAYDICGDDCRILVDVGEEIIKQTNSKSNIVFEKPEKTQPQKVKVDISKIKGFGYNPKIKIEEGIGRLVKFYLTEGQKWIN